MGHGGARAGAGRKTKPRTAVEATIPAEFDLVPRLLSMRPGRGRIVLAMAGCGASTIQIAAALNLSPDLIEARFSKELRTGRTLANANVIVATYNSAVGNPTQRPSAA